MPPTRPSPTAAGNSAESPQIQALVQGLVDEQVAALKEVFQHQQGLQASQFQQEREDFLHRENILRAQIQELEGRFTATNINQHASHPPEVPPANSDALMVDQTQQTRRAPRRRRRQPQAAVIPDSAPARNLRSRTHAQAAGGSVNAPTTPSLNPQTHAVHTASVVVDAPTPAIQRQHVTAKKSPAELYRILDSELPKDIGGLKEAMSMHIRILWGLSDAQEIPGNPPDHILRFFDSHVTTSEALQQCRQSQELLLPLSMIQVRVREYGTGPRPGRLPGRLHRVEEHIVEYIESCLARFGLIRWLPDLRQTPYSLYNSACRIVALDTFKQALVSHAYSSVKPNLSYARDIGFLIRLYDHIVHHYLYSRYKKEQRRAGSVQAADKASPGYRSRCRLADARTKFLQENGYPQRYIDIIDKKTTSDDERDDSGLLEHGQPVYWIKKRPERSTNAETFIRKLDQIRKQEAMLDSSKRWRERLRKVPDMDQKDSEFLMLPEDIPIDYYSPPFFNSLQPRLRRRIASEQVAFLPDVSRSFGGDPDELLSDDDFLMRYGDTVLRRYKLDDLDRLEEWIHEDEDGEDEDNANMGETEDMITDQRTALVQQLSEESV